MKKSSLVIIAITVVIALGCAKKSYDENSGPGKSKVVKIRLQQQWFANSGFAGELCAMRDAAKKYSLDLSIQPGSDQIDPKQVVKLGAAEFGVAGAEQVLQANEAGADLIVIGVINSRSLACFISKKKKGILIPKDLVGKKVGTMENSPVDLVYKVLKKSEKLNIPLQDEIPTGWVMTGFERGDYDVYPAFVNDEPITLKRKGVEVNIIKPDNYGVKFIGTVYFCTRKYAEENQDVVQRFVNSMADGWKQALRDPKTAIKYLEEFDKNIDEGKELESLLDGAEYYKGEGGKVLFCNEETWKQMSEQLHGIEVKGTPVLTKPFDFSATVQNKFVSWYHTKVSSGKS